jgi:hypothetical protein
MNGSSQIPQIERLDFFNGQRLFAEDLQTLDGFNRRMRWLHNSSLHDFGIGSGFVVRAERGDREVAIAPGYAIDNEGREIILLLPRVEPVPPVADDGFGNPRFYDLTVHYPRDEDLEEVETRAGICQTHGVVRRQEEPIFCWIELDSRFKPTNAKHAEQIAKGEKIVLARISVKNCRLESLLIANRRNARPDRLPHVACGRTTVGATDWRVLNVILDPGAETAAFARFVTVGTVVNTSGAKFAGVPCYNARVAGQRLFRRDEERIVADEREPDFVIEGFVNVVPGATLTEFKLHVSFPVTSFFFGTFSHAIPGNTGLVLNPADIVNPVVLGEFLRSTAKWYVEWMGVEG